jgi:hypothetical protein
MKYVVLCLLLAGAVFAQTRQVNMQGTVQELADREISIMLSDARIVTFKVLSSTKFNDGLNMSVIQRGDHLIVQGTQDQNSFLTAATVSLDAAAMAAEAIAARKGASARSADATQPSVRRSAPSDDGGPPVLKRGKPAPSKTATSDDSSAAASATASPTTTANPPAGSPPSDSSLKGVRDRPSDDYAAAITPAASRPANLNPKEELLERAREYALNFTDNLPNYVAQQYTTRYMRIPGSKEWHAQDVVSANVVYENGKEDYRNVAINGKPVNKKMEELPGSWSTGEFGTTLRSLFHPGRQAQFTYVKQAYMNGMNTWVYDYKVRRENSDWHVSLGSQSIVPAYEGRVWIDEKTAQVLRIEMSATDIPRDFPLDQVEASNDYGFVRLATADQYMLPTHAETLSCERGSPVCSRNTIEFRNYHKYTGEANITFDK